MKVISSKRNNYKRNTNLDWVVKFRFKYFSAEIFVEDFISLCIHTRAYINACIHACLFIKNKGLNYYITLHIAKNRK